MVQKKNSHLYKICKIKNNLNSQTNVFISETDFSRRVVLSFHRKSARAPQHLARSRYKRILIAYYTISLWHIYVLNKLIQYIVSMCLTDAEMQDIVLDLVSELLPGEWANRCAADLV